MKKVYLLSALIVIQLATCSYRDKLGTTFFGFSGSRHEVALNKAFCIRQKYKAERAGFEFIQIPAGKMQFQKKVVHCQRCKMHGTNLPHRK